VADKTSAILISYVYLPLFLENRPKYHYRDWVLDSGAFSAHNSGKTIKLQEYINACKNLLSSDPTLTEVFALDVIGDWQASLRNTEEMWRQGVPAIPTYHTGEPKEALIEIARKYPKIALGGAVGMNAKAKLDWTAKCFSAVWPKRIHGLGFGTERPIMTFPFHSVDATNWEADTCRFGKWKAFGYGETGSMSIRGGKQNLRAEVLYYLDLEERARGRWRKEMAKLDTEGPTVRLAVISNGRELRAFPLKQTSN